MADGVEEAILVGELSGAHGVRGDIKMRPLMEKPEMLAKLPHVTLRYPDGSKPDEPRRIKMVRPGQLGVLLRFMDVIDRNEAEKLRGALVFIKASELPKLGSDTYYERDLIGLRVVTEQGGDLGIIEKVLFLPANDVYETAIAMIPAIGDVVLTVDIAARHMTVRDMPGLRKDDP